MGGRGRGVSLILELTDRQHIKKTCFAVSPATEEQPPLSLPHLSGQGANNVRDEHHLLCFYLKHYNTVPHILKTCRRCYPPFPPLVKHQHNKNIIFFTRWLSIVKTNKMGGGGGGLYCSTFVRRSTLLCVSRAPATQRQQSLPPTPLPLPLLCSTPPYSRRRQAKTNKKEEGWIDQQCSMSWRSTAALISTPNRVQLAEQAAQHVTRHSSTKRQQPIESSYHVLPPRTRRSYSTNTCSARPCAAPSHASSSATLEKQNSENPFKMGKSLQRRQRKGVPAICQQGHQKHGDGFQKA